MNGWEVTIALVALAFSVVCFALFVLEALKKPKPEDVARQVTAEMAVAADAPGLDPRILGQLAAALASAFSKIGPGLVALIGAILFLLLAGEAANVYNLTGSAEASQEPGDGDTGGNETGGNETGGNETGGNEAGGNATEGNATVGAPGGEPGSASGSNETVNAG